MPFQWRGVVDCCPQASVNLAPTRTANQNKETLGPRRAKHVAETPVQLDYEAAPCVVTGKRRKNVAPDSYHEVVTGYTIMNDVSMREIQMKEMKRSIMLMGRNLDTTAPTGPYLVTKDEIADPQNLQISTFDNGERRQFARRTR